MHVKNEGTQILKVLCGSRAYGLNDADSDYDYHGVYVVPTSRLLAIDSRIKETQWVEGESEDNTAWEIGHFLRLATHCNPTILETFVAPVKESTETGLELRKLFPYVLARKRVFDAFRGYAANQRKKMFEPTSADKERRMQKAAIAYLRSLWHGTILLMNGTYMTQVSPDWRKELMVIRNSDKLDKAHVIQLAEMLESNIEEAYQESSVPEEPDMDKVNEFLLRVRKENW